MRIVGRVDENWLVGQINGREGLIPTSFMQIIEEETGQHFLSILSTRRCQWNKKNRIVPMSFPPNNSANLVQLFGQLYLT